MSPAAVDVRPYIGLRYFEERDAHLFYGRDEHVTELLAKVAENRFVAVMGSSGCGKSSLVRAGLLPELGAGMIPKAGPRWKVIEFRPGRAPLQELAEAIRSELKVEQAEALVEAGPLGIARAVAEANLNDHTNVLVIADQFEEIFRFQREESAQGKGAEAAEQCQALTRRLLDAAAQPELPIYVLLVMRSDYLGECAQFPDLPERMSESLYLVPRLRRDQLQEAINAPLGGAIEPAVVQRLLSEVGSDPDQLPRLQHLLVRMWDQAAGGRLTMQHYRDAGGWETGLEQHLEEVYARLTASQQAVCSRMFQQLSELDKGRAVRRRADIRELIEVCGPEISEVVRQFRAEGFLMPREDPVDITHECILREWPRLKEWLEKENRNARRLRELAEAAEDAGWRLELNEKQRKPIRGLAGLTLQNLVGWRDDSKPSAAWAQRYVTTVDFDTAYGYLQWSQARDRQQKARRLWLTRFLVGLVAVAAVLAITYYRRAEKSLALAIGERGRADQAFERARAAKSDAEKAGQVAVDEHKRAGDALDLAKAAEAKAVDLRRLADKETQEAERQKRTAEDNAAKAKAAEGEASLQKQYYDQLAAGYNRLLDEIIEQTKQVAGGSQDPKVALAALETTVKKAKNARTVLPCVQPGVARWPIKTSLPPNPKDRTMPLDDILKLPRLADVKKNDPRYQDARIMDQPVKEDTMVTTSGWIYLIAFEQDNCDFHIQISPQPRTTTDPPTKNDNSLIVAVPSGEYATTISAQVEDVRKWVIDNLLAGAPPRIDSVYVFSHPVFVTVTGALFYNDAHTLLSNGSTGRGKKGMESKTLWELHPVISMAFAPPPKGN